LSSTADFTPTTFFMGFETEIVNQMRPLKRPKNSFAAPMEAKEEEDIWWWMEQ